MRFFLISALCIGTLFLGLGCNTEDSTTKFQLQLDPLLLKIDDFSNQIHRKRVLKRSTPKQQGQFRTGLRKVRSGLIFSLSGEDPQKSLLQMQQGLYILNQHPIHQRDQAVVADLLKSISAYTMKFAHAQGLKNQDIIRVPQFLTDFSEGIGDCRVFDELAIETQFCQQSLKDGRFPGVWYRRIIANNNNHVEISNTDNYDWLVSPSFNFSNLKHPALQLKQLSSLSNNTKRSDVSKVHALLKSLLRLKVSKTYISGHPISDKAEINNATWETLDIPLDQLPPGKNFQERWTDLIDLSDYAGEPNVSFAFVFESPEKKFGSQYLTWQIHDFIIYGQGELKINAQIPPVPPLLEGDFSSGSLGDFKRFKLKGTAGSVWEMSEHTSRGQTYKYAKVTNHFAKPTNSLLLSPIIKLTENTGQNVWLNLRETFNKSTENINEDEYFENFKLILFKENSDGIFVGQNLKRNNQNDIYTSTSNFKTQNLNLNLGDFEAGRYQIGFLFEAPQYILPEGVTGKTWDQLWQISSVSLQTEEALTETPQIDKRYFKGITYDLLLPGQTEKTVYRVRQ